MNDSTKPTDPPPPDPLCPIEPPDPVIDALMRVIERVRSGETVGVAVVEQRRRPSESSCFLRGTSEALPLLRNVLVHHCSFGDFTPGDAVRVGPPFVRDEDTQRDPE